MKNMKKKIIAIVVMLGVLGTIITGNIHAANGDTFKANITFGGQKVPVEFTVISTNPNKVSLTNNNRININEFVGDLIIPETVQDEQGNTYDVTEIGKYAFSECYELTSTGLESNTSITTVNDGAFVNCTKLTSTGLENNTKVTTINGGVFRNCIGLETVVIPEQITCIESSPSGAFRGCVNLKTVIFNGKIPLIQFSDYGTGQKYYSFPEDVHFYYLEGTENISNLDNANSSPIQAAYTLDVNITDEYDKYHVDDIYTGEDIVVTKKYMSEGSEIYKTQIPKEVENIILPDNQKLVAGRNTINGTYNGASISFEVNASDHDIGDWEIDKEPTTTSEGLQVRKCKICGEILESETIEKLPIPYTYQVTESEENYTKGTNKDMTYRIDGDYSLFIGVKMDGNDVSKDNYTSKQGSTVITFKSAYLESLSEGNHEMTVMFHGNDVKISLAIQSDPNQTPNKTDDGTSETKPDIPADSVPNTPALNDNESTTNQTNDSPAKNENVVSTSDETSMLAYMGILMLSGVMGGLAFKKRKEI